MSKSISLFKLLYVKSINLLEKVCVIVTHQLRSSVLRRKELFRELSDDYIYKGF